MAIETYRRDVILTTLEAQGRVRVTQLVKTLGVSDMTIRRDLQELEADGLIRRVHGGAVPAAGGDESSALERTVVNAAAKERIARRTAELIPDGSKVIMDSGTTVAAVAPFLRGRNLTIVTGSILVAKVLGPERTVSLELLGGQIRSRTMSVVGPSIEEQLTSHQADMVLLGASWVSPDGFFNLFPADVPAQRAMMSASATRWLLADDAKFTERSAGRVGSLGDLTGIITTAPATHPTLSNLGDVQVEIV